jgi:hypothetical protein
MGSVVIASYACKPALLRQYKHVQEKSISATHVKENIHVLRFAPQKPSQRRGEKYV